MPFIIVPSFRGICFTSDFEPAAGACVDKRSSTSQSPLSFPHYSLLRLSLLRPLRAALLSLRLLFLLALISGLQLLNRLALLFVAQLNLSREHDAHRPGRVLQEVFEGAPEAALHIGDGVRKVGADLRRRVYAKRIDRMTDETTFLDEERALAGQHLALFLKLGFGRAVFRRRAGDVTRRYFGPLPTHHKQRKRLRFATGEIEIGHDSVGRHRFLFLEMRDVPRKLRLHA